MDTQLEFDEKAQEAFNHVMKVLKLSDKQGQQIKEYISLLLSWNERFNLTTITDIDNIINYHFLDSLLIGNFIDFSSIQSLVDVGTGAGFPGLPLKIRYPHLKLFLIEVHQKKLSFLSEVIERLALKDVELIDLDWRTFLRKTDYSIDLFCARASLAPAELLRMYKPTSPYKNARLIYWASASWQPDPQEKPFVEKEVEYTIKSKRRKYVFFRKG